MTKEWKYLHPCAGFLLLTGYLVFTPSAHAHLQQGQAISFVTGLEHPWSGLDHVLAMIAVGLWGAQLGNPAIWTLPIIFPLVMSLGAMMGLLGIHLPGIEIGIAASAIVLGIMVLGEVRPKLIVAATLVGCFAVFHGHAHGTEMPHLAHPMLYALGFFVGTASLHVIGVLIGVFSKKTNYGEQLLRYIGAGIAGVGFYLLIM